MRSFSSFDDYLTDAESDSTLTNHPLRDADEDSVEVLNEFSIRSATPAIALGYLVAQHQKVKSGVTRATSAKTIEDRLNEILKVQLVQSRQSLAMGALLYGLSSKRKRR